MSRSNRQGYTMSLLHIIFFCYSLHVYKSLCFAEYPKPKADNWDLVIPCLFDLSHSVPTSFALLASSISLEREEQ